MYKGVKGSSLKADILLVFISLIWGSTFIVTKKTIETIPPITFNSVRFIIASILLLVIFLYRPKKINRVVVLDGFVLGVVLFLTFTFQTMGLKFVTASETGFITGLYLIFVPIISVVFLKKSMDIKTVIAVFMAFTGLFLISFHGNKIGFGMGEFLVLLNALFVAFHIVLIDYYCKRDDVFALTSIQIFVLTILSVCYALLFEDWKGKIVFSGANVFAFFLTGVMATVVAFLIQTYAQKFTTPTKAAVIFTLEPLSAAFFGFLIGGEILTRDQYVGAFLIFLSMLIIEIKFKRSKGD
ncbi:MAG: DMT family transporter [Calditerrivibrio sp.]|nr:DMT family transporter [Calditerrivibrio sp.]MCA1932867.1 DMT family transporter [Calditerrivibrio sp.]MCA1979971.1 DMT family transporter [Calditerrivibrio sp.]